MSKRIFINNLNTYVSQDIFKELRNDEPDENGEVPDGSHMIFGSYINKDSSEKPDGIKKMLKVSFRSSWDFCLKDRYMKPRIKFELPSHTCFLYRDPNQILA